MDRSNLADVQDIWNQNGGTSPGCSEFGRSGHAEVPDPYYGGDGFEQVLDLIMRPAKGCWNPSGSGWLEPTARDP